MSVKINLNNTLVMTKEAEKKILQAYAKSLKTIRNELAGIYAKYETAGVLTYAEMSKYNRLSGMFDILSGEIKEMTGTNYQITKRLGSEVYQEGYYQTAFAIEKTAMARLRFSVLRKEDILASVLNPISGLTLNERLSKNRIEIIAKTKEQITQGLIKGESYKNMSDRIKELYEGDAKKSMRIVRTEGHRNTQQGILNAGEHAAEMGIKMLKVWDAAIDDKTRDDHRDMDGEKVKTDEDFTLPDGSSGPGPGMTGVAEQDIQCRCRLRYEIEGYAPEVRRVRGEGVVPYETYNEFKEAKGI